MRHSTVSVSSVCVLCLGLRAFCQIPQVNSITGVPDYVLYHFFFNRVMWLQDQADKKQSQGKDGDLPRNLIQQQAGLTNQQASALVAIASDWRVNEAAIRAQVGVIAAAGARLPASPQLQALQAQSHQLVLDHLGQLQTALGPGAFYVLDLYVRRTVNISGPGITPVGN
ncbi:MAG: hypothetical protein ABSF25_01535 [Bryobacteraceae bacterium]|jgi:hypothetical protein